MVRLLFDAPDRGVFEFQPYMVTFELGDPLTSFPAYAIGAPGRAGETCNDCTVPCLSPPYCAPQVEPEWVELMLAPESSTEITLAVQAVSPTGPGSPCPVTFEASDPWMTLEVTQLDWYRWEITVTVNTTGLECGNYSGFVRSATWCTGCAAIDLTVAGSSRVEEAALQVAMHK